MIPLVTAAKMLETIDDRLMECRVSRRSFVKFRSALMVAAPFGLAITEKLNPEAVANPSSTAVKQLEKTAHRARRQLPRTAP